MTRYLKILMLITLGSALLAYGCGGGPPEIEPQPTVIDSIPDADTTTVEQDEPPPPPPRVIKASDFQTVYFDLDKFNLRSDARSSLDANLALMNEFPDLMIKIEGHCDERGTVEYNLSLGEKRSSATMDYLVAQGVDASRISTISYGKERPVNSDSNEAAWSANRRSEFLIISQ